MKIKMIFASDMEDGIGVNNTLPWGKLKSDMMFFRKKTIEKNIIMGRKTFESLGCVPLPKRNNIILSSLNYLNVESYKSIQALYNKYEEKDESFYVIGGAQIYKLFEKLAVTIYHTRVKSVFNCDTFYKKPVNFKLEKEILSQEKDENNNESFSILKYGLK